MLRQAIWPACRSVPDLEPFTRRSDVDERMCSCGKPVRARDMCSTCYARWSRALKQAGQPLPKGRRARHGYTAEMRFLVKVDKDGPLPEQRPELGPCWVWTGAKQGSGYGVFYLNERSMGAHVAGYILAGKTVPEGMELDHLCHPGDGSCPRATCRHILCVNPAHLEPVTRRENVRRSSSLSGQNMAKTHCDRGHEFTPENTYIKIMPNGRESRQCHACRRLRGGVRGDLYAPVVRHADKTHCPKDHPYDEENTYINPKNGGRMCRICRREAVQAFKERAKKRNAA